MVDAEVAPWLRGIPAAPEYHPSEADFADPISYISKIEEKARQYGMCKIVPPVPKASKKSSLCNLNKTLQEQGNSVLAKFTTRKQQLGWSCKPSRNQPLAQRFDWQAGSTHTVEEFEARAKAFARGLLGTCKEFPALALEALFWKTAEEEPMFVECATDIPGSGFSEPEEKQDRRRIKEKETNPGWKLANSGWNLRQAAQSNGSLLKFMQDDIPRLTSPVLQIAMLYSWEGWHLEEHELYSLDYIHTGSGKTWYAVPAEAANAFEELMRAYGYEGQLDLKGTLALLAEKRTILSPEVLASAGIPCCRLVQNAGEFVVTFPRAYHFVFSHGFSWAESVNISTPGWLKIAKEATVRRTNADKQQLFCYEKLLYESAMFFAQSKAEVRSSRLKKAFAEEKIKTEFINSITANHQVIDKLRRSGQAKCLLLEDDLNLVHASNILLSLLYKSTPNGDIPAPRVNWGSSACAACGVLCFSCIVVVQPSRGPDYNPHPCIFCPEHALASQFELHAHGGSRVLIICHPDYHTFERNAEQFAKDLDHGNPVPFLDFEKGDVEDFKIINLAVCHGYKLERSWSLRLLETGSRILKKCEKQAASDDSEEDSEPKSARRLKEKKCWIVGRWCGRVWRHDQTNSLLGGGKTSPLLLNSEAGSGGSSEGRSKETKDSVTDDGEFPVMRNFRKRKRSQIWKIEQPGHEATPRVRGVHRYSNVLNPKSELLNDSTIQPKVELLNDPADERNELPSKSELLNEPTHERNELPSKSEFSNEELPSKSEVLDDPADEKNELPSKSEFLNETGPEHIEPCHEETRNEATSCSLGAARPVNGHLEAASDVGQPEGVISNNIKLEIAAQKVDQGRPEVKPATSDGEQEHVVADDGASHEVAARSILGIPLEDVAAAPAINDTGQNTSDNPCAPDLPQEPGSIPEFQSTDSRLNNPAPVAGPDMCSSGVVKDDLGAAPETLPELQANARCSPLPSIQKKCRRSRSARGLTNSRNTIWHDVPITCSYSEVAFIGSSKAAYEGFTLRGRGSRAMKDMPCLHHHRLPDVENTKAPDSPDGEDQPSEDEQAGDEVSNASGVSTSSDSAALTPVRKTRSRRAKPKLQKKAPEVSEDEEYVDSRTSGKKISARNKRVLRSSSMKRKRKRVDYQEVEENDEDEAESQEDGSETGSDSPSVPPSRMRNKADVALDEARSGEYKCDMEGCTMSFQTEAELATHRKNICTIRGCAKQLCSHNYLAQHYRVHLDDRPLKCPWKNCRKTFKWSWARTEHIRVHTGARPYACADCGKSYRFVSDFSRHKRTTGHAGTGLC